MMEKEKEEIKILGDDKKILTILAEKYGGEVLSAAHHSGSKFFTRVSLDKEQLQKLHEETLGIPVCLMILCK